MHKIANFVILTVEMRNMKKLWERVFIILAIFIAGFAFLRPQAKAVTTAAPIVVLSSDQSVSNDYVAAGNSITLSGTVSSGDAYVAGGTVLIDGTVDGDLLVAGGNITITGTVNGNVRAAGGNIVLSGRVGKNFSVAAGNVTVGKDATIGGNLVSFFGNLEDNGQVSGNMTLTGGHVSLGGTTQGNIDAKVAQLSFAKGRSLQEI